MTALMPLPRSRARLSLGRVGLVAHHGIRSGSGPAAAEAGNPHCFYDDRETSASHRPVTSSSASAAQTSPSLRISRRPRILVGMARGASCGPSCRRRIFPGRPQCRQRAAQPGMRGILEYVVAKGIDVADGCVKGGHLNGHRRSFLRRPGVEVKNEAVTAGT